MKLTTGGKVAENVWLEERSAATSQPEEKKKDLQLLVSPSFRRVYRLFVVSRVVGDTKCSISPEALRYRLEKGWPVEKAVSMDLMRPQESGRMGADVTNGRRLFS